MLAVLIREADLAAVAATGTVRSYAGIQGQARSRTNQVFKGSRLRGLRIEQTVLLTESVRTLTTEAGMKRSVWEVAVLIGIGRKGRLPLLVPAAGQQHSWTPAGHQNRSS